MLTKAYDRFEKDISSTSNKQVPQTGLRKKNIYLFLF